MKLFTFTRLGILATFFVLTACSTSGTVITGNPGVSRMEAFSKGNIKLTCVSMGCAFTSGNSQPDMEKLSQQERWTELANMIMDLGFGNIHAYYYLGRAAEGLNYLEAAKTYYSYSLSAISSPNSYGHDIRPNLQKESLKLTLD
jgi:hypothetical protein